jgi:uncharacterized protein YraI
MPGANFLSVSAVIMAWLQVVGSKRMPVGHGPSRDHAIHARSVQGSEESYVVRTGLGVADSAVWAYSATLHRPELRMPLVNAKRRLFVVLLCMLPISALALSTTNTRSLNVRSGPGRSFRVVTVLPPRTSVWVRGCTSGWQWCDVDAQRQRTRGWVDSRYLQHSVRGRVPIVNQRGPWGPPGHGGRPAG